MRVCHCHCHWRTIWKRWNISYSQIWRFEKPMRMKKKWSDFARSLAGWLAHRFEEFRVSVNKILISRHYNEKKNTVKALALACKPNSKRRLCICLWVDASVRIERNMHQTRVKWWNIILDFFLLRLDAIYLMVWESKSIVYTFYRFSHHLWCSWMCQIDIVTYVPELYLFTYILTSISFTFYKLLATGMSVRTCNLWGA